MQISIARVLARALCDIRGAGPQRVDRSGDSGHQSANVTGRVVKGSGHWLMEGEPQQTMSGLVAFINGPSTADPS